MKLLVLAVMASALAAGCASRPWPSAGAPDAKAGAETAKPVAPAESKRPNEITIRDGAGTAVVQKVALRPGLSSTTVEKLARRHGCTGDHGAGRLTESGPVEIYRMECDNGGTFTAKCEFRQCKPLR